MQEVTPALQSDTHARSALSLVAGSALRRLCLPVLAAMGGMRSQRTLRLDGTTQHTLRSQQEISAWTKNKRLRILTRIADRNVDIRHLCGCGSRMFTIAEDMVQPCVRSKVGGAASRTGIKACSSVLGAYMKIPVFPCRAFFASNKCS